MKVLFVTRDKAPGRIGPPIAQELMGRQAEVLVAAEGLSLQEWKNAGFASQIMASGPLDIYEPWTIDIPNFLKQIAPDIIVCGLSSPMGKEEAFARAFRELFNKPVIIISDNWGAHFRLGIPADLVLTIDELDRSLINKNAVYCLQNYQTVIIGDPSAMAAKEQIPAKTIQAYYEARRGADYVFLVCSQKWPESIQTFQIALTSCTKSLEHGAQIVIIPRFHPGASENNKGIWNIMLGRFSQKYSSVVRFIPDTKEAKHDTNHLATLADATIAITGSALRAAAYAGKIPVCVWSKDLATKLQGECGSDHHPLAMAGAALEMQETDNIVFRLGQHRGWINQAQKKLLTSAPFDAEKAAEAIILCARKK